MKRLLAFAVLLAFSLPLCGLAADAPLRVFIRSGPKSHGPGAHDYPRFLREWVPLLNERGARATGADAFPTAEQLAATDVLILHAQEAGNIPDARDRANLNTFLARGGGLLVIHAGVVSRDPNWFKGIVGGSWRQGTTKWLEGPMHLYFVDRTHPVIEGVSNWAMDDEIYYDMDLSPDVRVLATAYTPKPAGARSEQFQKRAEELTGGGKKISIYDIQPQMWTYERTVPGGSRPYRAFVSIPGHLYENFNRPNYRALLLRAIAWAGQRGNVNELCRPEELGDALRYPEGGPTHPTKAAAKIEVHPEFNLSLVASEPLINKVMNIDWDERGRLWVCETPEYPNGRRAPNTAPWKESGSLRATQTQRAPEDRISILSDTNGDGVMDRKHVFADQLELVTSFVLHKNGVIAACAPDIWFLEDTNGDEIADKRTKLYTGLGINDTHAVINNLRWGLDGWIYATHGYSRGDVTSGDGKRAFGSANSGVVRFKPDGSAFEQYSSRGGNTWGLETTWDGQIFWTQPTSGTVFFHTLLPESVLAKAKLPGTTSWKGMITNQRTYPAMTWPEQAYVQIDQVGRFTAGAGCAIYEGGAWPEKWNYSYFTSECTLNLVHHQFVRPEGVSYTTAKEPGRDETEFIRSTDLWFRPIETRIGPDGALYLVDFYNQAVIHNDTRGPQHGPANAAVRPDRDHYFARIWRVQHKQAKTLEIPKLDRSNLAALIRTIETSPNAHVKKTAWRLAQENHGAAGAKALGELKRPAIGSKAEQHYATARAASTPAAREAVLREFAQATDDWTRSALVAGAVEHAEDFLIAAMKHPQREALGGFAAALATKIAPDRIGALLVTSAAHPSAVTAAILRGLTTMAELPALDPNSSQAISALLAHPETSPAALLLAQKWDRAGTLVSASSAAAERLLASLVDAALPGTRRAEVAQALLAVPTYRATALAKTESLLTQATTSESLREALAAALGDTSAPDATEVLVNAYGRTKSPALFEHLLKRPESALALVSALQAGTVRASDIGPAEAARLRTHPNRRVATEAAAALSQQSGAKDELVARLLPEVVQPGDFAKGRMLFVAACAQCHKLGDLGQRDVGPPLAGIGAHAPAELLAHIVDPNRQVEPNYWQWNVTTKKGETLVGVLVGETAANIVLRNQGGDTEVKKDDIVNRENTRRSFMPEGFEGLGAAGLRDLIAFLAREAGNSSAPAATTPPNRQPAPNAGVGTAGATAPSTPTSGPKEGGRGDAPLPPTEPAVWEAGKTKVLLISGGSSHKFAEFFGAMDAATLRAAGFSVHYTEDRDQAAAELANADVAVVSVNRRFFDTPAYRKALVDFAAAGKGLIMLHPGTWYAYPEWPELNAKIVGGGARGHDRIQKFSVNILQPTHPVMLGVPSSFEVEDELYYLNAEPEKIPAGTAPITVLAETSPSQRFGKPHPAVWVTDHPHARIVGITLGHDQRVHQHPAFVALLVNTTRWVARTTR